MVVKLFSQQLSLLLTNFSIVTRPRDQYCSQSADTGRASSDPWEASREERSATWVGLSTGHASTHARPWPRAACSVKPTSPIPDKTRPSLLHSEPWTKACSACPSASLSAQTGRRGSGEGSCPSWDPRTQHSAWPLAGENERTNA